MSQLSDEILLRAYCSGDRGAFDAIYRRYCARAHATAYRLTGHWEDAEDTLQDVFVRLANKAGTIRRGASLSAWIYRATINRATDCLRRRRMALSLDQDGPAVIRVIAVESLRREAERELSGRREMMLRRIEALIPRLPPRQGAVFVLRSFQGLAHREIASILGFSESCSKSHYCLACRKLRQWVASSEVVRDESAEGEGGA